MKSGNGEVFDRGLGQKTNGNGDHHRDTEDTENFAWVGMGCGERELLNRFGIVRSDILGSPLSDDFGPTYRRDWPGDIWGTLRLSFVEIRE